ncbi:GUN4 domain-containing protein, partial [Nostoc punctiforme UO1]|uniref:GUN4 domain-containing protein n=1 Tax=Nostoc punctiforme TaxID=272131 RepID=UPI003099D07C
KKADEVTFRVMRMVAKAEPEGYLDDNDFDRFPCVDLQIINQLWLKYSKGKFGFSVQKEIYESLGVGRNDIEVWENFCDHIGWRKGGRWLNDSDLTLTYSL